MYASRSSGRTRLPPKPFGNVLHIEDARASDDDFMDDDEDDGSDPFDGDFYAGWRGGGKRGKQSEDDEDDEDEDDDEMVS